MAQKSKRPKITVNETMLAKCLATTVEEVRRRADTGEFRPVKGQFDLAACAQTYAKHRRAIAAGHRAEVAEGADERDSDPIYWTSAHKVEVATATRIQLDILEGRLAPKPAIDRIAGGAILAAKARLESLPQRLPRMIHGLENQARADLSEVIRACLKTLVAMGDNTNRKIKAIKES